VKVVGGRAFEKRRPAATSQNSDVSSYNHVGVNSTVHIFCITDVLVVLYCVSYGLTLLYVTFRGSDRKPGSLRYGLLPI
jgi:hypothetical protein